MAAQTSPDAHIPVFFALMKLETMHFLQDILFFNVSLSQISFFRNSEKLQKAWDKVMRISEGVNFPLMSGMQNLVPTTQPFLLAEYVLTLWSTTSELIQQTLFPTHSMLKALSRDGIYIYILVQNIALAIEI